MPADGFRTAVGGGGEIMRDNMRSAWWALRVAFFVGPFLAGLDKFFHVLVNWDMYLSPTAQSVLGGFSHPFMLIVGVVEMIVGLMVITRWTRWGAYIASLWLLLIAINLVTTGRYFDIALRDIGLCISAFGLAKLTEAVEAAGIRTTTSESRLAA
jgi:hypothetical protein